MQNEAQDGRSADGVLIVRRGGEGIGNEVMRRSYPRDRGAEISSDKAHRSLRTMAYLAYVEFAGEEQRRMTEFMPAWRFS